MPAPPADILPATGRVTLRITHPGLEPAWVPLTRHHVVLGRAEDVDVPLDSHTVSRRHAELFRDPFGRWWVRDLASRNGTRVNGNKVREAVVGPGDALQIGDFLLALAADESAAPHADTRGTYFDPRVSVTQQVPDRIHRLREFPAAPRIGHAHLTAVLEFGHALNVTPDAADRLARLCALVLAPPFPGLAAAALRLARDNPAGGAQILHSPAGASTQLVISSGVLRALADAPAEPVVATNVVLGGGGPAENQRVELSIAADVMEMSVAAVPLRHDAAAVDLLYVSLAPECGDSDWLALIALAVKQYQQAEDLWRNVGKMKEYAAIERELERAQQIQERLVPRAVDTPGLATAIGFTPCNWVGGDYVDVVPMTDGRVLLVVADVCGKGLPAALVAQSVHTMVHAGVRAGEPVGELIALLNEYVCEYLGEQSYATMICVAVDPRTGACECGCAGHPAGLVVAADGTVRPLASARNLPLGLDRIQFRIETDRLAPGELLVLFSDGVTELRAENGDMLGPDGLAGGLAQLYAAAAGVPLPEFVAQLNTCLDAFRGAALAADDRTFLLARLGR